MLYEFSAVARLSLAIRGALWSSWYSSHRGHAMTVGAIRLVCSPVGAVVMSRQVPWASWPEWASVRGLLLSDDAAQQRQGLLQVSPGLHSELNHHGGLHRAVSVGSAG